MTTHGYGRVNQKVRTRTAILEAASSLARTGAPVTMPEVARVALVSEVTAYRYFPDLRTLLVETVAGLWPTPTAALEPVADSTDPVERVTAACAVLLRGVIAYEGAVRAMIAATIGQPALAKTRPDIRFQLIDLALDPLHITPALSGNALDRLKQQLGVVISAESLFCLTDRFGLSHDDAVESVVAIAATLTATSFPSRQPGRLPRE